MASRNSIVLILFGLIVLVTYANCEEISNNKNIGRQLIEQGRTFVHHAVKRMAILLPVIFFKLGVAFTLLILVTIVAVNNGFIGFMLLIVGLSTVLAKLQEARTAPGQHFPIAYASPHFGPHFLDRSDVGESTIKNQIYGHSSLYPHSNPVYSRYSTN